MTDTPVDTAVSPDLSPERDTFAHAMASVIGEWYAMSPPTRRVLGRVAPKLADGLWRAELAMEAIIVAEDRGPDTLVSDLVANIDPRET